MANYQLVVNSQFRPFSMQEMLVPLTAYKEAYDKAEADYLDLADKSDKFKYMSETLPEGSRARQIYEGYANELSSQAEDLMRNGLNVGNRRSLLNLKRRYSGEIGRLEEADNALQEELKMRRELSAKDNSILFGQDNLSVDDFLDRSRPNLYSVSGNDLYKRGMQAGQSTSSRYYTQGDAGSTLNGYYRQWVETRGVSPDSINAFMNSDMVQQEVENILAERGVTDNLTGANYAQARQSVLNGIYDGIVYEQSVKPIRDEDKMSASERDASARAWTAQNLAREKWDEEKKDLDIARKLRYKYDDNGDIIGYNTEVVPSGYAIDPNTGKLKSQKSTVSAEERAQQTIDNSKQKELLKLDRSVLSNNSGFDVTFGNDRHHYDYVGALSKHGDSWYSGKKGDDNPGHNFPGAWGWASTSNVENAWGNFTYAPGDNAKMRVLSQSEIAALMGDSEIAQHILQQVTTSGFYNEAIIKDYQAQYDVSEDEAIKEFEKAGLAYNNDIQVVAVNNEWPNKGSENYLVAIRTK